MKRSVCIWLAALAGTAGIEVLNNAAAATVTLPLQTRDEQNRPQVSAIQVETVTWRDLRSQPDRNGF